MEKNYTIEYMEFVGVYFPELHKIKVKAHNLESAICESILKLEDSYIDGLDIEDNIEEIKNEFGYKRRENECIALSFNKLLDDNLSNYRLLRGYCGKRECFNLVIEDEY